MGKETDILDRLLFHPWAERVGRVAALVAAASVLGGLASGITAWLLELPTGSTVAIGLGVGCLSLVSLGMLWRRRRLATETRAGQRPRQQKIKERARMTTGDAQRPSPASSKPRRREPESVGRIAFANQAHQAFREGAAEAHRGSSSTARSTGHDLSKELHNALSDGERLYEALMDPARAMIERGRSVDQGDIDSWMANTEHLLRNDKEALSLFRYRPLDVVRQPSWLTQISELISGKAGARELHARLIQLRKIVNDL